ncbi:MAG: hypothetical protein IK064_07410, partial [Clostridia bacterium]|nr:hypothetical protein [Clostridia bacterium]
ILAEKGITREKLMSAAAVIERAGGTAPGIVICSQGGETARRTAASLGMTAVAGSVDLVCLRGSAAEIEARALDFVSGGDIVICAPTAAFAAAFSRILEYYSALGLTTSTVSGTIYD